MVCPYFSFLKTGISQQPIAAVIAAALNAVIIIIHITAILIVPFRYWR